jgi:hypothetical protein
MDGDRYGRFNYHTERTGISFCAVNKLSSKKEAGKWVFPEAGRLISQPQGSSFDAGTDWIFPGPGSNFYGQESLMLKKIYIPVFISLKSAYFFVETQHFFWISHLYLKFSIYEKNNL